MDLNKERWLPEKSGEKYVPKVVSLKENCIDHITENFDVYNTAFLFSTDATLRRNLQFLQRKYSSHIILHLSKPGILEDRHLDFLINEHLKILNFRILCRSAWTFEVIKSRIAETGHTFTKFISDDLCFLDDERICELIPYLPNVEILHLLHTCTNTTLEKISINCNKLCEVVVNESYKVTDEGVAMLCKGKLESSLKVLSLIGTSVTKNGIINLLENMPSLEVLNCVGLPNILYSMHEENVRNNTLSTVKKYNLNRLYLLLKRFPLRFTNSVTAGTGNILSVWTILCPNVSTMKISILEKRHLDLICRFSKLEHLTLKQMPDHNLNINNLLKSIGSKLQSLEIEKFNFSVSVLIENCPILKKLVLENSEFEPLDNTKHIFLNNLSELVLINISFSSTNRADSINCVLQSSPKLETLVIDRCIFDNSELNWLSIVKGMRYST